MKYKNECGRIMSAAFVFLEISVSGHYFSGVLIY